MLARVIEQRPGSARQIREDSRVGSSALEGGAVGRRGGYEQLGDPSWLRRRYIEDGASVRMIAGEVGCNPATVCRAVAAAGLSRDSDGVRRRYPRLKDVEWLRERYVVQGARIVDIAAEVGCGELAVRAALARARLPLRGVPLRYPQLRDRSWLRLRYVEQRVSVRDMAGEVGCDESAVYEALDAAAIARIRPRGGPPRQFPELNDQPWLRHRYLDQGRTQRELAAEIGCSIRAVRKALAKAQIVPRRRASTPGARRRRTPRCEARQQV
jgi:hypothetical protein